MSDAVTNIKLAKAEDLTNAIDKLIFRRLSQLTASDANEKERSELAGQARLELRWLLERILPCQPH